MFLCRFKTYTPHGSATCFPLPFCIEVWGFLRPKAENLQAFHETGAVLAAWSWRITSRSKGSIPADPHVLPCCQKDTCLWCPLSPPPSKEKSVVVGRPGLDPGTPRPQTTSSPALADTPVSQPRAPRLAYHSASSASVARSANAQSFVVGFAHLPV